MRQHSYSEEDSLTYMLEAVNVADLVRGERVEWRQLAGAFWPAVV